LEVEVGSTMNIEVQTRRVDAQTAVIVIAGEMDVYTTPQVKDTFLDLLEKGYHHLVVDLQRAEYLDSTALGVLVGTLKRARERGGELRLVAPPPKIRRLLEITRLIHVFSIDASEQEATAHLAQEETNAE
jgi:anti-sigma B factor antagonist